MLGQRALWPQSRLPATSSWPSRSPTTTATCAHHDRPAPALRRRCGPSARPALQLGARLGA